MSKKAPSDLLPPEVEDLHKIRARCKAYPGGLFFFTKGILNQNKLTKDLHLPFCNMLQLHDWNGGPRYSSRKVGWLPREHFKSTCVSKSLPLWLLSCVDRNMTIALVSANQTNTNKWLRFIKDQIEYNGFFRALFPEIRPGDKWDQSEIVITRDRGADAQTQASITALSIGSGLASQHFDYLICDDLVNEQTAQSAVEMEKAVTLYHALEDILQGWESSKGFNVIGTPWGREDVLWEALKEERLGRRLKWGLGALGNFEISKQWADRKELYPTFVEGQPILPSECGWDKLNFIKERNREQFQLQYLCNPYLEGANGFEIDKIKLVAYLPDGYLQCSCPEHQKHRFHHIRFCSVVAVSDPAYTKEKRGCESATLVGALAPCGCRFLLEERGEHLQPLEYVEMACGVAGRWKTWLRAFCPEDEALQLALKQWLEERQAIGQFPLNVSIFGVKSRSRAKDSRIENAIPAVNAGLWHCKPDMQKRLGDAPNTLGQLFQWPFSRKRDRADAFAYFEDAWAEFPADKSYELTESYDLEDRQEDDTDRTEKEFLSLIDREVYGLGNRVY